MEAEMTVRHLSIDLQRLSMENQKLSAENKLLTTELVKVQTMAAMNNVTQTAEIMKHFHNFMQGVPISAEPPTAPVSPPTIPTISKPISLAFPPPGITGSPTVSVKSPLNSNSMPFFPSGYTPTSIEQKKPVVEIPSTSNTSSTSATSIDDLIKSINWTGLSSGKTDTNSWSIDACKW
jgi:hypothetical protein